jgi:hypothetical protein
MIKQLSSVLYLGLLCAAVACSANPPPDAQMAEAATVTPGKTAATAVHHAPTETVLYPVVTEDVQIGQTGIVEIRLDNIADLYGLHIRVTFDPDHVQVEDANPEEAGVQIVPGEFPPADFVAAHRVDNEHGVIEYAVTQTAPREPVAGSGVVAAIHFRGVELGATSLVVEQALLSDKDGQAIAVSTTDGEIEVK